ncbi:MAG: hypothetical protein DRJ42_26395 [Deltaproteobacteria bacterium]|nr:MAG: hypothetical protein DRJ42_26395 [Deltaproteobacteria bacterium]
MAEVFRARQPQPVGEPRLVAIKRMLPAIAAQAGSRAMFEAESHLGTLIQHPNVVEVLDVGEEGGQPYLALEYVRGLDLGRFTRFLTREGLSLDLPLAIFVVRQLLAGLHAVHIACQADGTPLSVVHRDVSPSNVLLSKYGDVKLADFGIAFAEFQDSLPQGSVTDHAQGKLGYLAPEQVTGDDCDRRADIFSGAAIAAELVMGRPLFGGGSELAILLAIRDAEIHPLIEMSDTLPAGLTDVLGRALSRNPEERIATALELSNLLAPYEDAPESALRRGLAELVTSAMHLVENGEVPPTPLVFEEVLDAALAADPHLRAVTEESSPDAGPVTSRPGPLYPHVEDGPQDVDDVAALEGGELRIVTAGGLHFGPWTYARLVEAIMLGKVGPFDRLKISGGKDRMLGRIPALERHIAPHGLTTTASEPPPKPTKATTLDLANGGITSALAWGALRRDTGLWLCEFGGSRKEVYLKDGTPAYVTSNLAGELLGEYLVARSVISRGELDMALAVLPRYEGRLGDTLVAIGLIEPVQLFQQIAGQVREKLLDIFMWIGGRATYHPDVEAPTAAFPLDLEPWSILDEGVDRRLAHGLEDERFEGRRDVPFTRCDPLPGGLDPNALPIPIRRILEALEAPSTVNELTYAFPDLLGGSMTSVPRSLVVLAHLGAIVLPE